MKWITYVLTAILLALQCQIWVYEIVLPKLSIVSEQNKQNGQGKQQDKQNEQDTEKTKGSLREQYVVAKQKADDIKQQNAALRRENDILRAEVEDLRNGYEATSEIARYKLGYIGEGETFYNLKPE